MNSTVIRALSGSVYVAVIIGCLYYGNWAFIALMAFLFAYAVKETIILLKKDGGIFRLWLWVSFVLTLGLLCFEQYHLIMKGRSLIMIILLAFSTLFLGVFSKPKEPMDKRLQNTLLAIFYLFVPLFAAFKLTLIDPKWLLYIFIFLWANDTMAFVFGKWLGKHKLLERLSPKKTIEGFIGGLIGAAIAAVVIAALEGNPYLKAIFFALMVGIAGTVGDLFESMLKRKAKVKDSGNIMPGHGGILDRIDSFLFAVPIAYFYFYFTTLFYY